jgi:hypothetical protein
MANMLPGQNYSVEDLLAMAMNRLKEIQAGQPCPYNISVLDRFEA